MSAWRLRRSSAHGGSDHHEEISPDLSSSAHPSQCSRLTLLLTSLLLHLAWVLRRSVHHCLPATYTQVADQLHLTLVLDCYQCS